MRDAIVSSETQSKIIWLLICKMPNLVVVENDDIS